MVSVNPFRLSVQVMRISCTPRPFRSVRHPSGKRSYQSCRPTYSRLLFNPFCLSPTHRCTVLLIILPLLRILKTIPSIHTIRYMGSKGLFCHPMPPGFTLVGYNGYGRSREFYFIDFSHLSSFLISETLYAFGI